ncbi:single-stranded DNA-binding protein [Actinoplanes sp. TRM 88003]|uniref:Single-stranded DNA-binding protein n=1 Tax=Paractinoplanes aksuensis TaxID=2939490 RepID=A0ABT1DPD1_9ACTN|nr:single-stranded DNA-binding protein [Actinoplanes aksuensis]MCO8272679.1 single-stranded DNA-binding protein [Actinoplanes aksuensis]
MFDTNLVVVGNVLMAPEWRRLEQSGSMVANFRVASTARRFDRETSTWVDGRSLRVRVTAWRRLAEGVISSIGVGDPVIVYGRLFTRDWKDSEGNDRISYEMEAYSIGHDLARGRSRFARNSRTALPLPAIDDAIFIGDEPSAAVPLDDAPVVFGEGLPEEEAPTFLDVAAATVPADDTESSAEVDAPTGDSDADTPAESPTDEEIAAEVEQLAAADPAPARRSRRTSRKEPVAA